MRSKSKISTLTIFLLSILTISVIVFGFINQQKEKNEYKNLEKGYSNENIIKRQPEKNKIFIDGKPNSYKIYLKGTGENFVGYNFERKIKELDKAASSSNYDTWNINTADEYYYIEDLNSFKEEKNIVTTGEWEMAIRELNASDFSGGILHGDEVLESYIISIDGEDYTNKSYKGNAINFEVEVISNVFRDNTLTNDPEVIATHTKKYLFNTSGLTIDQNVTFNEAIEIDVAYLGMLPVSKDLADIATINGEEYSLDENIERLFAEKIKIKNEDSTIEMEMSVLENNSPQEVRMMVVNTDHYNKIYSVFLEKPYYTFIGEEWNQVTHYSLITHN